MKKKKKFMKVKDFAKQCLNEGITTPSEMAREYNNTYKLKKPKTDVAFTKALRRMGISAKQRLSLEHEAQREKEVLDIEEYPEVKRYLGFATFQEVGRSQKQRTISYLRELWKMMDYTNPRNWSLEPDSPKQNNLILCLKENIGQDENGQWKQRGKILQLLGAFNRTFTGYLPKGWSMGLKREAGELKDFMEFDEFNEFIANCFDTPKMSKEGWEALFKAQVNMGCREGTKGNTGIISLKWESINFKTQRCEIRDKGKKGKPARLWIQVPLNMFYWVKGWEALIKYHEQTHGYKPTQERHARGLCFPVKYDEYRKVFHAIRHKCNSRINQDLETMKPHIFRKTHAQWSRRIGVSLENLCGNTESAKCIGRYGVGWDDPKVPLKYYLTPEPEEYAEQDQKIEQRLQKLRTKGILPVPLTPLIS